MSEIVAVEIRPTQWGKQVIGYVKVGGRRVSAFAFGADGMTSAEIAARVETEERTYVSDRLARLMALEVETN